jgi:hypothetical protein
VTTPASREEVAAVLGEVDDSYVDRVLDTGASLEEIGEAIDDLEGRFAESRHVPSSAAVARVREILRELTERPEPHSFPLRGIPLAPAAETPI